MAPDEAGWPGPQGVTHGIDTHAPVSTQWAATPWLAAMGALAGDADGTGGQLVLGDEGRVTGHRL